VVAANPKTGEILAMVSYPTYENNRMSRFIPAYYYNQLINDPSNPLLNHAVGDVLPAGSVFKLSTGTGALNEGVVTPDQIIATPPKLEVTEKYYANDPGKSREFVDWNKAGFGHLDFVHGLANSSNVYFYKLGGGYKDEVPNGGLGICRLGTYAAALGYGLKAGIGLPDEENGLIPNPTWKRINQAESWSSGDTYISSVGQGYVLATPVQVLYSAMIVSNNGKFMQPTLVKDVLDAEGNVVPMWRDADGNMLTEPTPGSVQVSPFNPAVKWDLTVDPMIQEYGETTVRGCEPIQGKKKTVAPWVFQTIQTGMRLAVTEGTLKKIFEGATILAAGKTGTAEYCDKYALAQNRCIPGNWPSHAWTVGYAPFDNPEIAVVAFVYNGNEGSSVAGPIIRRVMEAYFELKNIDNASRAQ
jgi:penicillin-binding protein 2